MPALTEQRQGMRMLQALQAFQLMLHGLSKSEACDKIGISIAIFDTWIEQGGSEAIEAVQRSIGEMERNWISQLSAAQSLLIDRLVSLLKEEHDPEVILKALKFIGQFRGQLEAKHSISTEFDQAEEYLMGGPKTYLEDSKMIAPPEESRASVNVRALPDGSVDISIPRPRQVIDYDEWLNGSPQPEDQQPSEPAEQP